MAMLEFGSGRSTAWFAERVGRLTSVEHDAAWAERVAEMLGELARDREIDFRVVPLDHPSVAPEQDDYDPPPDYVRVCDSFEPGSLDMVLVDGHYRTHCARQSAPLLKPGGVILVDDAQMWGPNEGPHKMFATWEVADDSTNGIKRSVAWRKPLVG